MAQIVCYTDSALKRDLFHQLLSSAFKVEFKDRKCRDIQGTIDYITGHRAYHGASETKCLTVAMASAVSIPNLLGLPGAFTPTFYDQHGIQGLYKLLDVAGSRTVTIDTVVAICYPDNDPILFKSSADGTLDTSVIGELEEQFIPNDEQAGKCYEQCFKGLQSFLLDNEARWDLVLVKPVFQKPPLPFKCFSAVYLGAGEEIKTVVKDGEAPTMGF